MKISDMNWSQVEDYLSRDDRAILPIGSTEQHAGLSLAVDSILAEKLAIETAEPVGVPVFPVVSYGCTPQWRRYPGTVTIRLATLLGLVRDILDSLAESGFKRIMILNGHGGNQPVHQFLREWNADNAGTRVKFHNWFDSPKVVAKVKAIDPVATHASWFENFPWTRLEGVTPPARPAPVLERTRMFCMNPDEIRAYAGDGNNGGVYQHDDADMLALWEIARAEARDRLEGPWG